MPGVGAIPPAEFQELASYLSFPQALTSAGDLPGKPPSTDGLRTEYSQRGGPFSWDFCFASLPLTRSPTGGAPGEMGKGAEVSETCLIEFSWFRSSHAALRLLLVLGTEAMVACPGSLA